MTTHVAPHAAPRAGWEHIPLWAGAVLVALPPAMGLSMALTALSSPAPGKGGAAQAVVGLWYVPEAIFPVALIGVALLLLGLRRDDRAARRAAWLWTALVVVGLAGTTGVAFLTGLNRSEDALTGTAKTTAEGAMAAFGLLYVLALVALVVLALQRLRPSLGAWARLGTVLLVVTLVISASSAVMMMVPRRGPGAPAGPTALSPASDMVLWAVLGLVVLAWVAARTRTMRGLVAVAGTVLVAAEITSAVLGARAWRLSEPSAPGASPGAPTGLTTGLAVVSGLFLAAQVALLVAGIVLVRRTRDAGRG